jgi:tricorn protease
MTMMRLAIALIALAGLGQAARTSPIRLARDASLSPDGKRLAFAWRGDIWIAPAAGGTARQLTTHAADEAEPRWSPDGKEIAFTSDRRSGRQVWIMPAEGGHPEQVTFHTSGFSLQDWYPDGKALLVRGAHDSAWRDSLRFWRIPRADRLAPQLVFDDYGEEGQVAPEGDALAFSREGAGWWRKGYRGSQSGQLWLHQGAKFRKLLAKETECRWPMWRPDGKALYYVGGEGSWNLHVLDLESGSSKQLTTYTDDSVVFPAISRDGSTIVFRRLFDLYRYDVAKGGEPVRIELAEDADAPRPPTERRTLSLADAVAFSNDGLEMAFISGGDVWVMDTVLKEPRQVTNTPEFEHDPVFTADGGALLFCGAFDVHRAERTDEKKYWWQQAAFTIRALTEDPDVENDLRLSPDGSRVAFIKGRGDLWTMAPDGKDAKCFLASWNGPDFDWSPDGKWIVYAVSDNDFNRDIWIAPLDASQPAYNVSRHPDNESDPAWSPDGKCIAFTGQRRDSETDIFYVWLRREDDEKAKRERTIEEALEKMKKARSKPAPPPKPPTEKPADPPKEEADAVKPPQEDPPKAKPPAEKKEKLAIDFDTLHERVRRISNPDVAESNLFWSFDSKKLCFSATVAETRQTFAVDFPEAGKPKAFATKTGSYARWLKEGNQIVWLSDGVPGTCSAAGALASFTFSARQQVDVSARHRAAFVTAWRIMRDSFYDERLGNRDWEAVRKKYEEAAAVAADPRSLQDVVNLMLGELNGSHLGFRANLTPYRAPDAWDESTPHLGVRWDRSYVGAGMKVQDVLPGSPADKAASRLAPGDIVLKADGVALDPSLDLTAALNGPLDREIRLVVKTGDKEREVLLRPMAWGAVSTLVHQAWLKKTRAAVDELSTSTLGFIHIRGMDWPSFEAFEADVYAQGSGKDGLIIDVRENGGGFTADHLLTILCQPAHAITVPRGGGAGYPQDRKVYASWDKPVIVLCNQNSFSNAEIFAHAMKTLKRARVVGVPTAGGVISTGGASVMDVGSIRTPGRGWFLPGTGEDMELNGAVPDIVVWPEPGDRRDVQLEKAVEALLEDVAKWKERPRPALRKSSERK